LVEWAIALHGMYESAMFFEIGELTDSNLFVLFQPYIQSIDL
jgi:hypothetical protein